MILSLYGICRPNKICAENTFRKTVLLNRDEEKFDMSILMEIGGIKAGKFHRCI
jgi:hypothetical protein